MAKIYHIDRKDICDYDEYDGIIVIADSPREAVGEIQKGLGGANMCGWKGYTVRCLGESRTKKARVVLASYNAG